MARDVYQKLSGRSAFSDQEAYFGKDHLLIVEGTYRERVKRIDYEAIEAILVCPTKMGAVVSLLAGLGGLFLTAATLANIGENGFLAWLIVTLVVWSIFGAGLYRKGSVVFGLQTAVQTVILGGVGSRRKADRVKARLAERVEAVQGRLSAGALQAAHQAQRSAAWEARGRPKPEAGRGAPPPIRGRQPVASPEEAGGGAT